MAIPVLFIAICGYMVCRTIPPLLWDPNFSAPKSNPQKINWNNFLRRDTLLQYKFQCFPHFHFISSSLMEQQFDSQYFHYKHIGTPSRWLISVVRSFVVCSVVFSVRMLWKAQFLKSGPEGRSRSPGSSDSRPQISEHTQLTGRGGFS